MDWCQGIFIVFIYNSDSNEVDPVSEMKGIRSF
jgi:hypothetical protein